MIFVCKLPINKIKGYLYSILSLSGQSSYGSPYRVRQIMVLIKTVSKTNSPLFCLSVIYIQKSLQRWKKDFLADTEKISGLNSIYFHAKTILSGDYFLAYFGLWSVIHSNRTRFIFSWTINVTSFSPFLKFVHNPHNLEIDSFKVAVSEHILLYLKNSNSLHMIMCGTCCVIYSHDTVMIHGVLSFSTGKHSTYFHRICTYV